MYFGTLELKNFGPFSEYKTSFSPNGINLIVGHNGVGKTQITGAIIFSLMGKSVVDIMPSGNIPSEVSLAICEGQIKELIRSRYDGSNPDIQITQFTNTQLNSADLVLANFLRKMLHGGDNPQLVLSVHSGLDVSLTDNEISLISQMHLENNKIQNFLVDLINSLKRGKKNTSILSEGQRNVVIFLKEYVKRQTINRSIPLIIDDFLSSFDSDGNEIIGNLLDSLCQKDQVIILTHFNIEKYIQSQNIKTRQTLEHNPSAKISLLTYNYFPRQFIPKAKTNKRGKYKYIRGEKFQFEENRYYELKEVKGANPIRSIISIVDEYAVAFLNMGSKGVGRIYWGISDDRDIVGVNLDAKERDELRRLVTEKLHQIKPPVVPSSCKINFLPVLDSDENNQNRFLVEVTFPSSQSDFLFSTGKDEVYIKTDAGRKKLTALEIQIEILDRHNK